MPRRDVEDDDEPDAGDASSREQAQRRVFIVQVMAIRGIGASRAEALYDVGFRTLDELRDTSREEFASRGIGSATVNAIRGHFGELPPAAPSTVTPATPSPPTDAQTGFRPRHFFLIAGLGAVAVAFVRVAALGGGGPAFGLLVGAFGLPAVLYGVIYWLASRKNKEPRMGTGTWTFAVLLLLAGLSVAFDPEGWVYQSVEEDTPAAASTPDTWGLIYHNAADEPFIALATSSGNPYRFDIQANDDCVFICGDWKLPCNSATRVAVTLYFVDETLYDHVEWSGSGSPCGRTFDLRITASGRVTLSPLR